jgi:hypothetical protein
MRVLVHDLEGHVGHLLDVGAGSEHPLTAVEDDRGDVRPRVGFARDFDQFALHLRIQRVHLRSVDANRADSGFNFKADEALAIGLVDEILPADVVYARAVEWASQFVGGPALALRAAKAAIDGGIDADLVDGLETERREFAGLFKSSDQKAGMQSFVENGPGKATFEGR